jgi:hypothetical protein
MQLYLEFIFIDILKTCIIEKNIYIVILVYAKNAIVIQFIKNIKLIAIFVIKHYPEARWRTIIKHVYSRI